MKATLSLTTNIQLTFKQLKDLAKQLPEKQRRELATILVDGDENMTKDQLVAKIKEGLKDAKLYKEGKIKLRTLDEFLSDV
jgi:phosphopantothenate synthetase